MNGNTERPLGKDDPVLGIYSRWGTAITKESTVRSVGTIEEVDRFLRGVQTFNQFTANTAGHELREEVKGKKNQFFLFVYIIDCTSGLLTLIFKVTKTETCYRLGYIEKNIAMIYGRQGKR